LGCQASLPIVASADGRVHAPWALHVPAAGTNGSALDGAGTGVWLTDRVAVTVGVGEGDRVGLAEHKGLCHVPVAAVTGLIAESTMQKMMRAEAAELMTANRKNTLLMDQL
jgi:hypothetical protein